MQTKGDPLQTCETLLMSGASGRKSNLFDSCCSIHSDLKIKSRMRRVTLDLCVCVGNSERDDKTVALS